MRPELPVVHWGGIFFLVPDCHPIESLAPQKNSLPNIHGSFSDPGHFQKKITGTSFSPLTEVKEKNNYLNQIHLLTMVQ